MMLIIGAIVALLLTVVLTVIFRKKEVRFGVFNLLVHPAVLINWGAMMWVLGIVYGADFPVDALVAVFLAAAALILNGVMFALSVFRGEKKKQLPFEPLVSAMFFVTFAASVLYPLVVYSWRLLYFGAFALGTVGLWLIMLVLVFIGVLWDKLAKFVAEAIERRCNNG